MRDYVRTQLTNVKFVEVDVPLETLVDRNVVRSTRMAEESGMTMEEMWQYDDPSQNKLREQFGQEYSLETFKRAGREGFLAGFKGLEQSEINAGSVKIDNTAANEEGIHALNKYLKIELSGPVDLKKIEAVQFERYKAMVAAEEARQAKEVK